MWWLLCHKHFPLPQIKLCAIRGVVELCSVVCFPPASTYRGCGACSPPSLGEAHRHSSGYASPPFEVVPPPLLGERPPQLLQLTAERSVGGGARAGRWWRGRRRLPGHRRRRAGHERCHGSIDRSKSFAFRNRRISGQTKAIDPTDDINLRGKLTISRKQALI